MLICKNCGQDIDNAGYAVGDKIICVAGMHIPAFEIKRTKVIDHDDKKRRKI